MMIFMMTIIVKMSRMIMMITTVAMMRMRAFYANIFPQFALYPAAPDTKEILFYIHYTDFDGL